MIAKIAVMETSFSAWTTDRFSVIKMRRKVGVIITTQNKMDEANQENTFFKVMLHSVKASIEN